METVVNPNSQVYYSGQYWNDFPRVVEYMCENFTGDRKKWWVADFQERFCPRPFEHALVLNCGNGWVERDFVDKGIAKRVTAFDYSMDLLRQAQKEKGARPIFYFQTDVNRADFQENQFDLIVNVAALHHVQYINRLCFILCKTLQPHGIFVNFDYIGPHRNQYSFLHWYFIERVNHSLPERVRKTPFVKPHLPTMLYTDPTEAIHSELIFASVARYFEIFERHDTGGGIAYEILTHNSKLKTIPSEELNPYIDQILAIDRKYSESKGVPPMFSYFLARPNKQALADSAAIRRFQQVEEQRESWSRAHHGAYSIRQYITAIVLHKVFVRLYHFTLKLRSKSWFPRSAN